MPHGVALMIYFAEYIRTPDTHEHSYKGRIHPLTILNLVHSALCPLVHIDCLLRQVSFMLSMVFPLRVVRSFKDVLVQAYCLKPRVLGHAPDVHVLQLCSHSIYLLAACALTEGGLYRAHTASTPVENYAVLILAENLVEVTCKCVGRYDRQIYGINIHCPL